MKPVKQSVPINFAGGLDTKSDPRQVGPAQFLVLNNSVFQTGGQLTKRNGFKALGKSITAPVLGLTYSTVGSTLTNARRVFSYNDELLLNDAWNLYSYDEASDVWSYKGRSTTVGVSADTIVSGANTWVQADCSVDLTTGVRIIAFSDSESTPALRYSIQDLKTGQLIVNQAAYGAGFINPRCVSISGNSYIFSRNPAGGISYLAITGQTPSTGVATFASDLNATNPNFDVDVDPYTGNVYITYFTSGGAVTIKHLDSSMTVLSTISYVGESASNGISFFGDGSNIWVVYNNGSATKAFIVNAAVSSTILSPTVVDSGSTASGVNNVTGTWSSLFSKAFIFYDSGTFTPSYVTTSVINYNTMTVAGTAGTPGPFMGSVMINSKAFAVSGIPHIVGIYLYPTPVSTLSGEQVIQPTNFLLNLYNATPNMLGVGTGPDVLANIAAKISPDAAGPQLPIKGRLTNVHLNDSGAYELSLLQNTDFSFEVTPSNPYFAPTGVITAAFDFTLTNPDAQSLGQNALIAGGQVTAYDGATVAEQNFHIYPNAPTYTIATTGGNMGLGSSASLYGYIVLYEWIDNQGQVHRSSPSPVLSPVASGQAYTFSSGTVTGKVTLVLPCLRVTNKPGTQVVINVYRTIANGSVYFLLGQSNGLFGTYGTVINDPTKDSITFVDTYSDAVIQGNLQIYTTGAQPYFAPPASQVLTTYKNRMIAVPYEGGYDFLYSNKVLPESPVQFVPFFDQNIGTVGGKLITLAGMDDKLIIFKSGKIQGAAILYMVGQGPAPSGSGNDFTDPLPVGVDVGCVDRASVVLTPVGLMFKSNKGIYLLDRSLGATYIGAPVESYNSSSVLSAELIPNTTQVRFLLPAGVMLVYDYYYKQWSTFTVPAGISDCIFQGQHTYVSASGQVYQEAPGTYVDGTTPVLMNFTTAWIKLAGLQGYQRAFFFFLLAEYISAHQLQLQISYDFSQTPEQTDIITPNPSSSLENWRVFLAKQRCQAFQISLQEIYGGTPGAAFTMSGLNLIVGAKSSIRTISAAETVG